MSKYTRSAIALVLAATLCACGARGKTPSAASTAEEEKAISAILLYTYNAYASSAGFYGYWYAYFTPTLTETAKTFRTPPNLADPTATENKESVATVATEADAFARLCDGLRALGVMDLPQEVALDSSQPVMEDGSDYVLILYFEDGTTFTSKGYCAPDHHPVFRNVCRRLTDQIAAE